MSKTIKCSDGRKNRIHSTQSRKVRPDCANVPLGACGRQREAAGPDASKNMQYTLNVCFHYKISCDELSKTPTHSKVTSM